MVVVSVSLVHVIHGAFLWILFNSVATALPQARTEYNGVATDGDSLTYYIYPTPDSIDNPVLDDPGAILEGQPLTLVFHGFRGDHTARSMHAIKEALLLSGKTNVVVVDWSILADDTNDSALKAYHHVRDHGVEAAASYAARWIQGVIESRRIPPSHIHLVGFSLGAHVIGIVGQKLNSTVGRITGLDPPKFGYEDIGKSQRLDKGDAVFVNAMHTSGGILSYTETDPVGHVDFFPNGDKLPQEGCPFEDPIDIITCSHYFAFALFAESVFHGNAFMATKCDSWKSFNSGQCSNGAVAPMGYTTPYTTRGKFFLKTKSSPPYGEEDPSNPLPDSIKELLVYKTSEAFIQPQDVVNFITRKDRKNDKEAQGDDPGAADSNSGVMKVKGGSKTTTTPDPPSFQSSGGSSISWSEALTFLVTSFAGFNILQYLWDWWNSR